MMLNIIHIDTGITWRGGQKQVSLLCRYLQSKQYNIHLIVNPHSALAEYARKHSIPFTTIAMPCEYTPNAIRQIKKIIAAFNANIVHLHDSRAHTLGSIAARRAGVPVIIVSRRVIFPPKGWPFKKLKYTLPTHYIAVSTAVQKVLQHSGVLHNNITTIYSGIDIQSQTNNTNNIPVQRTTFGLSNTDFVVGSIGALTQEKDTLTLLKAGALLKTAIPNLRIIIIGDGKERKHLEETTRQLGIPSMVSFLGFRNDIHAIYQIINCFVTCSIQEGLGNTVLEAALHALPIIATRTGGIPEIVQHQKTGLLFNPGDVDTLAAYISYINTHPTAAHTFGNAAYDSITARFDYHITGAQTAALYTQLLNNTI